MMRVSKQTRRIAALVLAVFMALTSPVSSLADDDLVTIIPQETSAESAQPAGKEAETAVESESGQPEETTIVIPETETEAESAEGSGTEPETPAEPAVTDPVGSPAETDAAVSEEVTTEAGTEAVSEQASEETSAIPAETETEAAAPETDADTSEVTPEPGTEVSDEAPETEAVPAETEAPVPETPAPTTPAPVQEPAAPANPAAVFSGSTDTITVNVTAPEGAFPEGTRMVLKPVTSLAALSSIAGSADGTVSRIDAVDISFKYNGAEIEPATAISVSIQSAVIADVPGTKIVHLDDAGVVTDVDASLSEGEAVFESGEFSIYAVVETVIPRLTVTFQNGSTKIEEMYVKKADDADDLQTIIHDPGVGEMDGNQAFRGWTTDQNYTASSTFMTIDQVRADVKTRAEALTNKDAAVTYYAAIFTHFKVDYVDRVDHVSQGSETAEFPAYQTPAQASYTVNMNYTSTDDKRTFLGWLVREGSANIAGYEEGHLYKNGDVITITGDVTFEVYEPEGNWLIFVENGKGATYNAPQFIKSGENTSDAGLLEMNRFGYTFDGWYTGAPSATGEDPTGSKFVFGAPITEETRIYAKWKPVETANYTIVFWKQNVEANGYDFSRSVVLSGPTNTVINTVTATGNGDARVARVNGTAETYEGFHLNNYDQNVTITPEGDAVINVYYDRNVYTLRFFYARTYTYNNQLYVQVNCNNEGFLQGRANSRSLEQSLTYYSTRYPDYVREGGMNTWKDVNNTSVKGNPLNLVSETYLAKPEITAGSIPINNVTTDVVSNANTSARHTVNTTYYYLDVTVRYQQSLDGLWPTPNDAFVEQTMTRYNRDIGNYTTISPLLQGVWATGKNVGGKYSTMNMEQFVGDDTTAYFLTYWRFEPHYNYQYNVYFSALEGETGTVTYKGKPYVLQTDLSYVVANGQGWADRGAATDSGSGYWDVDSVTFNGTDRVGRVDTRNTGTINVYYDRQIFNIVYRDGIYIDGDNNQIDNKKDDKPLDEVAIVFDENISSYNKGGTHYYTPEAPEGFVFEGWYMDSEGKQPYTFTRMPQHDITVYAKWRQIEYRVFLHPNAGTSATDPTLDWGSDTQAMNFRRPYGSTISVPTGKRKGYEFIGWYTDEACTQVFSTAIKLNEANTTAYDKTTDFTDDMDPWGNGATYNKDVDRDWITKRYDLYAKWRLVLEGAPGIQVVYDENTAGGGKEGSAPTDSTLYAEASNAAAGPASKPADATKRVFSHWVVQKYEGGAFVDTNVTVLPGQPFAVLRANARVEELEGSTEEEPKYSYTVQLKAVYINLQEKTPTHIYWYSNYGSENDGKGTLYRKDDPIKINQGVDVLGVQVRDGYEFLGWTKVKGGTESDLWLTYDKETGKFTLDGNEVKQVAADEELPYEDMYAVWKRLPGSYVVHHYLKGTEIKVAEDVEGNAEIGATSTAEAASEYLPAFQSLTPAVNSYSPSQTITIDEDAAKNVITVYYTLPVTVTVADKKAVYNGETQYGYAGTEDGTLTVTGLLAGDTVKALFYTPSSGKNVGTYENGTFRNDPTIENAAKVEVSYYTFTKTPGKLTITKAPAEDLGLTVTSYEGPYDAASHSVTATPTVTDGTTLYYSLDQTEWTTTKPVYTHVADTTPTVTVYVKAENPNYETATADGTVKIIPIPVTITAANSSKVYGNPDPTFDDATMTGNLTGELGDIDLQVSRTNADVQDVGTYNDVLTISSDKETLDTTYTDYVFTIEPGDFEITKAGTLTVTTTDYNAPYDAKSHSITATASVMEGTTLYYSTVDPASEGFEESNWTTVNPAYTNVADTPVKVYVKAVNPNYEPAFGSATVTITKLPVTITAANSSKVYGNSDPTFANATMTGNLTGELGDIDLKVSRTNAGVEAVGTYNGVLTISSTKEALDTAYTNYVFTIIPGDFEITKSRRLTIQAEGYTGVYDGAGHSITVTVGVAEAEPQMSPAAAGRGVRALGDTRAAALPEGTTLYYSTVNPASEAFTEADWKTENPAFVNVWETPATVWVKAENPNYETVYDSAVVTLTKRAITVSKTAGYVYDGTEKVLELTGDLAVGQVPEETVTVNNAAIKGTLVGVYTDVTEYTWSVAKADKSDSTGNYEITVRGQLTITDGTGENEEPVDPELVVTKDDGEDDTRKYAVGEEVTWTITVTNIYNQEMPLLVEESLDVELEYPETLEPGETVTITVTYTVTEADVLAGSVTNTVTATVGELVKEAEDTIITEDPNPAIDVTKTITSTPANGETYDVGEAITYEVKVTNTGNLTLENVTVTDQLSEGAAGTPVFTDAAGGEVDGQAVTFASLAPGETKTLTVSYTPLEADAGKKIQNTAIARGETPNPKDPENPYTPEDEDTTDPVPVTQNPHLTVTKETTSEPENGEAYALGETITYKITVLNDGNVTVTGITVTDELTEDEWTVDSLEPGKSMEFTTSYIVKEADILAGKVVNEATATGTSPDPDDPDVPVDPGTTEDPTEDPKATIEVVKTITSTPANGETYDVGEAITYEVKVTNTGNLTLENVTVTDQLSEGAAGTPVFTDAAGGTVSGQTVTFASLAPGESKTLTVSYTPLEADAGKDIANTAIAKGQVPRPEDPDNPDNPDDPDDPKLPEDPEDEDTTDPVPVTPEPDDPDEPTETPDEEEIPDDDVPLAPPTPAIEDLPDNDVPLAPPTGPASPVQPTRIPMDHGYEEIIDDEVPQALPVTGQLHWPIMLLGALGVMLLAAAAVMRRRDHEEA